MIMYLFLFLGHYYYYSKAYIKLSAFMLSVVQSQALQKTMDSPMCLIDNVDGVLRPVPDAIDHLMRIRQRVVVVSVVG